MKTQLLMIGALAAGLSTTAQVEDSVAIEAGYTNQSFYNLSEGEVSNISNNNWDLAFDVSPYGATIRLNRRIDEVFLYPGSTDDWELVDTTGHNSWDQFANGHQYWSQGAFNAPADPADPEDLGWGIYNTITHATEGDRIFVVKLSSGAYKKLWIQELSGGTYTFIHANLDNTEEQVETLLKADYGDKNFAYYSLESAATLDREPASLTWDLLFTNYVEEVAPGYFYGVTGVLSNVETTVYASTDLPVAEANYMDGEFSEKINTIGYDWKSFNMETYLYDIPDSLCYFILTQSGDVWKLTFTGFNGSSDGKYYFVKEQIEVASVSEIEQPLVSYYPNPANESVLISSPNKTIKMVELYHSNGQKVIENKTLGNETIELSTITLPAGIYLLRTIMEDQSVLVNKLVVQH